MGIQPENQFDFWLGRWEVTWAENGRGKNHVEKILDGKIIRENFSSAELIGMSVSAYDPARNLWCQTWVDNSGSYLDFSGRFENERMILSRDAIIKGTALKQRMVWYNIQEDVFNWNWERSEDGGQTWRAVWEILYTRIQ